MENIRVLLVDDEEELSLVLAERLVIRGFDAEGVTSSDEALKRINEKDFDVMVVDVKMPGIDGIELMKIIKQKKPNSQVILFTGHGSVKEGEDGINEGAFDYLIKPVKLEDLIKKIKEAIEK